MQNVHQHWAYGDSENQKYKMRMLFRQPHFKAYLENVLSFYLCVYII